MNIKKYKIEWHDGTDKFFYTYKETVKFDIAGISRKKVNIEVGRFDAEKFEESEVRRWATTAVKDIEIAFYELGRYLRRVGAKNKLNRAQIIALIRPNKPLNIQYSLDNIDAYIENLNKVVMNVSSIGSEKILFHELMHWFNDITKKNMFKNKGKFLHDEYGELHDAAYNNTITQETAGHQGAIFIPATEGDYLARKNKIKSILGIQSGYETEDEFAKAIKLDPNNYELISPRNCTYMLNLQHQDISLRYIKNVLRNDVSEENVYNLISLNLPSSFYRNFELIRVLLGMSNKEEDLREMASRVSRSKHLVMNEKPDSRAEDEISAYGNLNKYIKISSIGGVYMLKELISLANHFDSKGLTKEADFVDRLISQASLDDEEIEGMFDTPPKKVEFEKNPDFTDEENISGHIGELAVNYIGRKHDEKDGLTAMKTLEEFVLEACEGKPCEASVKAKSEEKSGEKMHHEENGIGMTHHYHFNPENKLQEILHNCIMEILDGSHLYDLVHNAVEFGENIMKHVEDKSKDLPMIQQ